MGRLILRSPDDYIFFRNDGEIVRRRVELRGSRAMLVRANLEPPPDIIFSAIADPVPGIGMIEEHHSFDQLLQSLENHQKAATDVAVHASMTEAHAVSTEDIKRAMRIADEMRNDVILSFTRQRP